MTVDPKRKNLTTELKDLDVDRIDGVDRPATGRAFALFKSAASPVVSKTVGAAKPEMHELKKMTRDTIVKRGDGIVLKDTADLRLLASWIVKGVVNMSGIRVFIPDNGELVEYTADSVERLLTSMAGDGSRSEEMYPTPGAARFDASASIVDRAAQANAPAPPQGYQFMEPDPFKRIGVNYAPAGDPFIAGPAPVKFPNGGPMPQVDEPDMNEDKRDPFDRTITPVNKSGAMAKGLWSDLVKPEPGAGQYGQVTKALSQIEKSRQALPQILKSALTTLVFKAEQGYVVKVEGETSPTFTTKVGAMEFLVNEIAKAMNVSDEELKAALAALDDDATFRRECAEGSVQGALRRAQARELGIMKHGLLDGKRITSTPTTKRTRIV